MNPFRIIHPFKIRGYHEDKTHESANDSVETFLKSKQKQTIFALYKTQ